MVRKILGITLLIAFTQALSYDGHQGATSSVSFNEHHNTVHHIQSAPALVKTVTPVHAAVRVAAPLYAAPQSHGPSYSSLSLGQSSLPAARYTSPIASSLSSVALSHQASPSLQYAAPIAKVFAPVQHVNSYPSLSLGHRAPVAHVVPVAPVAKVFAPAVHAAPEHHEEYAHPKYEFAYGVEDHHTGDIHSHKEVRDGDVTQGEYSLHEADGTVRVVKYTVDKHSGFNAVVERSGHATHAQPAPVAKAVVAAPVLTKTVVAAPIYHH